MQSQMKDDGLKESINLVDGRSTFRQKTINPGEAGMILQRFE